MVLVLLGAAVVSTTAFAMFSSKHDMWARVAAIIGLVEALIWGLCLTNTVLLTIDAHQLRVPGITRCAVVGVALNGMLGWLLPAIVIGWFGGHSVVAFVLIALMSVCGFLYSLLPRAAGFVLYVAFITVAMGHLLMPWLIRPDFFDWAVPLLALGLALIALCWRRLLREPNPYQMSWGTPPTLRMGRMMSAAVSGRGTISRARSRPDWLQARPDLRRCGPGHPVRSLRLALGGAGMPQTFIGWLRQSLGIVLSINMLVVWFLVLGLRHHDAQGLSSFETAGTLTLLGLVAMTCVMQAVTSSTHLMARWRIDNAELPLLALLPKLGDHVKRDVLRAALWPALRALVVAAVLLPLVVARAHQWAIELFAVLVVVTAAAHAVAFSLHVLGGDSRQSAESRVAGILALVLFLLGVLASVFSGSLRDASLLPAVLWPALLAGWIVEVALLFRIGHRGWRGLQRRPHPFLVS